MYGMVRALGHAARPGPARTRRLFGRWNGRTAARRGLALESRRRWLPGGGVERAEAPDADDTARLAGWWLPSGWEMAGGRRLGAVKGGADGQQIVFPWRRGTQRTRRTVTVPRPRASGGIYASGAAEHNLKGVFRGVYVTWKLDACIRCALPMDGTDRSILILIGPFRPPGTLGVKLAKHWPAGCMLLSKSLPSPADLAPNARTCPKPQTKRPSRGLHRPIPPAL